MGKKSFFGPLLLLNKFRADLHMGEKGRMSNGGGKVFQICFYLTYRVFCAVRARPPRPGTTAAATTAATATRAITGVVRNVHVGKCVCNGRPLLCTKIAFSINRFLKEIEKQSPSLFKKGHPPCCQRPPQGGTYRLQSLPVLSTQRCRERDAESFCLYMDEYTTH